MLITSDILRGFTDTILLAQLKDKDSYGYEINKNISQSTKGLFELKEATLYTSFRRLEENKCIISYWGDEGSGARRRYYGITDAGKQLYKENLSDWENIKAMMNTLLAI